MANPEYTTDGEVLDQSELEAFAQGWDTGAMVAGNPNAHGAPIPHDGVMFQEYAEGFGAALHSNGSEAIEVID